MDFWFDPAKEISRMHLRRAKGSTSRTAEEFPKWLKDTGTKARIGLTLTPVFNKGHVASSLRILQLLEKSRYLMQLPCMSSPGALQFRK